MKKVLFTFTLLVASFHLWGGPSNSVLYLMNEPVTLFEKGLNSFQDMVRKNDQFPQLLHEPNTWGGYDIDKNRITISGKSYQDSSTLSKVAAKDTCAELIVRIKRNLSYHKDNPTWVRDMRGVASRFRPFGFSKTDEPDTLEADLANIITIEHTVLWSKNNTAPYKHSIGCKSDLVSEKIYFENK